jgi:hypothetical protein
MDQNGGVDGIYEEGIYEEADGGAHVIQRRQDGDKRARRRGARRRRRVWIGGVLFSFLKSIGGPCGRSRRSFSNGTSTGSVSHGLRYWAGLPCTLHVVESVWASWSFKIKFSLR